MIARIFPSVSLKRTLWKAWLMATVLSLLLVTVVVADSGDLDPTFSGDGLEIMFFGAPGFDEYASAVALQSDGKIVVAGTRSNPANPQTPSLNFAIARYNTDGTLDTSFSGNGRVQVNFGAQEFAADVAIQSDGMIVVVGLKHTGSGPNDLAVARITPSGDLDPTFSGDGKQVIGHGAGLYNHGEAVVIQPDGKIVIAGSRNSGGGSGIDFAVYRLNTDGSLDTTFSGNGRVIVDFGMQESAMDLALQSDGKIVVIGFRSDLIVADIVLARLNPDGTLDTTFSDDGKVTTVFATNATASSVAIQPDGKIVVSGKTGGGLIPTPPFDLVLARYNTDGTLDTSFSGNGKRVVDHGAGLDNGGGGGLVIQPDGKIVVAGHCDNGSDFDFALYRLNSDGTLDTTFSVNGRVRFDLGAAQDDFANDMALQTDGSYVLIGTTSGSDVDFALARVLP